MRHYIRCIRDLDRYGFCVLTGEADRLMFRQLVDVDEGGRKAIIRAFGFADVKLSEPWNSKSGRGRPTVGSFLLAPEDVLAISVAALFEHGCAAVSHIYRRLGHPCCEIEGFDDDGAAKERFAEFNKFNEGVPEATQYRFRAFWRNGGGPGPAVGERNVHVSSGRIT